MAMITITYEVHDDLTSERVSEYREIVTEALDAYQDLGLATDDQKVLIDKMLHDYERN